MFEIIKIWHLRPFNIRKLLLVSFSEFSMVKKVTIQTIIIPTDAQCTHFTKKAKKSFSFTPF